MKRQTIAWLLVASILFQPLMFEGFAWAQESASTGAGSGSGTAADQAKQAEEIQKQFDESYKKIMAMEEIKNPSQGGIGGFIKGLALKVTGKKKEVDEAVKKANDELKKMKEDMTKLRTELAAGVTQAKAASMQDAQAAMQKQLEAAAKIKTDVSKSMRKVGEMLNTLSGTLKKVATTLAGIAGVVAVIPVIGSAVSGVLFTVATVLGRVSAVVGVAGKAMITFSDKADISAADFAKTIGEAKDAWKKGGEEFKRPTSTKGDDKPGKGGTGKKDGKDGKTPTTDNDGTVKVDPKEKISVPAPATQPVPDKKDKPDNTGVGKITVPGGDDDEEKGSGSAENPEADTSGGEKPAPAPEGPKATEAQKDAMREALRTLDNIVPSGMDVAEGMIRSKGKNNAISFKTIANEKFPISVPMPGGKMIYVATRAEAKKINDMIYQDEVVVSAGTPSRL